MGAPRTGSAPGTAPRTDGANYLVVWEENYYSGGIRGARVTSAGALLDDTAMYVFPHNAEQHDPSVAFDGTNYLVVWENEWNAMSEPPSDIFGARIRPDGTVLDHVGLAIGTADGDQRNPSVAFDGTNHFVVWGRRHVGRRPSEPGRHGARPRRHRHRRW